MSRPDDYTQENATVHMHEPGIRKITSLKSNDFYCGPMTVRVYVDAENQAWWKGNTSVWRRIWIHPRDRVVMDGGK